MGKFFLLIGLLCWAGAYIVFVSMSINLWVGPFLGGAASAFFISYFLTEVK